MHRYGQTITWSTIAAPHLFTGVCTAYSYAEAVQEQLDADESGDNRALILHSHKAELNFEAKVTDGSTDFLDLSAGAQITVSGIASGTVLARRAVERWALQAPKTASISATHYPDMTTSGGTAAGTGLTAFTPDQAGLGIVTPGAKLIYGTYGMTHAAGVLHMLEMTQELQITEDEPLPDGTIPGAASHGYVRRIRLDILAKAAIPATGSVLVLSTGPANSANYKITTAEQRFASLRGKMYSVGALWIPPFA